MTSIYIHIDPESGHTVIVDDRIADRLTKDEALGVVASVLFGGAQQPMFVRTVEQIENRVRALARPAVDAEIEG